VKILLDQELIITSGREVIVQHRPAGEEACCLNLLFPYLQELRVEKVEDNADAVVITARSRAAEAACHRCGVPSARVNSRYRRRLHDLAAGGRAVVIDLEVRRFFCGNPAGGPRTFAEQVPTVAQRHQHRTLLVSSLLEAIGLALAGRAGARLASELGVAVSRSTLIRLVRARPDPVIGQVMVLGVDDFAKRRGHSYATILIDMDTRRPVDVLEDRQADTFAEWLKQHPGVQVICRDRAGAYAEGARDGAPGAIQVADRFHLWQNLCEAAGKTVTSCRADLREPAPESDAPSSAGPGSGIPAEAATPAAGPDRAEGRLAVRSRERHAAIHDLLDQGRNYTQICQMLGLTRNTVRRFARAATAGQVTAGPRPRSSGLDRFAAYLQQRWDQGCTDAAALHSEIAAQGYRGGKRSVRRYLQPLRATLTAPALRPPPLTVREVTRWITSHRGPPHPGRDSPTGQDQGPQPAAERHRPARHRLRRDDDRPPRRAPAHLDRRRRTRRPACLPALLHPRDPARPARRHQRAHPCL
jgi:Transposase/zinc-finger of transposase IS204/IS1001/IS1096/IS1165/Homeodomain-like domain